MTFFVKVGSSELPVYKQVKYIYTSESGFGRFRQPPMGLNYE